MIDERPFKHADKQPYLNFIAKYSNASNAASGSEVDANANVEKKSIATLEGEAYKREAIAVNRLAMQQKIAEMYGRELADQYIQDLESHRIYRHDETAIVGKPYCASITLYPFLLNGLKQLGGSSTAPHNLRSFNGSFVNLVYAVAAQLAGAVATPEYLPYLDYFIRKEYGDDYYLHPDKIVDLSIKGRTIDKVITDGFEQVVYCLNQPAGARNFQSVFWNIAYFDKPYFEGMFEDFVFPDGSPMVWESTSWLQKRFMRWFNDERRRNILTFPVETLNLLDDGHDFVDQEWADFAAEMWSEGHSFFLYRSDSVDSLASCCRLRNEVQDNQFSYTLGAGGVSTGSKCVMTLNINRIVQEEIRKHPDWDLPHFWTQHADEYLAVINEAVGNQVSRVHDYLIAFNSILMDRYHAGLLPLYDAGFVSPDRQYLTVGINGAVEAAEFLGCRITPGDICYKQFINGVLNTIHCLNVMDKTEGCMFNCEYVPAENLGVKNAKWDKQDGYYVPRPCYNSYFYLVEDPATNPIDKFILHGKEFTQYLDGGSALHCNLDEHLSKDQYRHLMKIAIDTGCPYFTFNIPNTVCRSCGHISKHKLDRCPKCGSDQLDWATRVIGYLKLISSFSEARQKEAAKRYYAGEENHAPGV